MLKHLLKKITELFQKIGLTIPWIQESPLLVDKDFTICQIQIKNTNTFLPGIILHFEPFVDTACMILPDGAFQIIATKNAIIIEDEDWKNLLKKKVEKIIDSLK